ncbi:MAG: hypothetical protein GF334_10650 [Candidatus Altiarchaeales archaeon]|nr:hypothetical protein [Candidatus Altiarchaeales archaeon]
MSRKPGCKITKALEKAHPISRGNCLRCKGAKLLCGYQTCPLLRKLAPVKASSEKLTRELSGPSPSIFIGWGGWPNVSVGQLTGLDYEKTQFSDDPSKWYGLGFDDIIGLRSNLVRSKKKQDVKTPTRFMENLQEIALSVKTVDTESFFQNKPKPTLEFNPISQPMGPTGVLKKLRVTDNPKIPHKVEYILGDELTASTQLNKLYKAGFDVYYLTQALSCGATGLSENKKIVPTRWSITAVDDMIAKKQMQRIRDYPQLSETLVYENTYLENHFEVLLLPGAWEFELFEAWSPNTLWTQKQKETVIQVEYEKHSGRTKYAFNEGGGYYAGRVAVTGALDEMRRQAQVVVIREIYDSYVVPVGVWEVRENVRAALKNKHKKFKNRGEALEDMQKRLNIPVKNYMDKSNILTQKKITDF